MDKYAQAKKKARKEVQDLLHNPHGRIIVNDKRPLIQRPVSGTVGRLQGGLAGLMIGDKAFFRRGTTKADTEKFLKEHGQKGVASSNRKGAIPLEIHSGHGRPIRDLKRVIKRKDLSLLGKAHGLLSTSVAGPLAALARADHYNPHAHSITSYHNSRAVKAHELGHAKDFARKDNPSVYTLAGMIGPVRLHQEAAASREASNILGKNKKGKKMTSGESRVLGAALGSYIGGMTGVGLPAVAAGHGIGKASDVFGDLDKDYANRLKSKGVKLKQLKKERTRMLKDTRDPGKRKRLQRALNRISAKQSKLDFVKRTRR